MLQNIKSCYIDTEGEGFMSDQKPKIGRKNGGREIAEKLAELRRRPIPKIVLEIVEDVSEATKRKEKKIAKSGDAEL